jgi:hypothetical protein
VDGMRRELDLVRPHAYVFSKRNNVYYVRDPRSVNEFIVTPADISRMVSEKQFGGVALGEIEF